MINKHAKRYIIFHAVTKIHVLTLLDWAYLLPTTGGEEGGTELPLLYSFQPAHATATNITQSNVLILPPSGHNLINTMT